MKNVGENTKLETALPVYHLTHVSSRYKIKSSIFFSFIVESFEFLFAQFRET